VLFQFFLPVVELHSWLDLAHHWIGSVISTSFQTFGHCRLELTSNLSILISVKDSPSLESRLGEHFPLDFPIDLSHTGFNVESIWASFRIGSHKQFSGIEFESVYLLRVVVELHVPQFLFLDTLGVRLEVVHEVFNFLYLSFSISVDYASKIFHQTEISSHCVGQSSQLT